jgi:RNA recognition motif-containing protein
MTPEQLTAAAAAAALLIGFMAGRVSAPGKGKRPAGKKPPKPVKRTASGKKPGEGIELYVGNLPYETREKDLVKAFSGSGEAIGARVIRNKFNGKSKGYGFVEMATEADAKRAASKMNGTDLNGRKIVVNEARSKSRD